MGVPEGCLAIPKVGYRAGDVPPGGTSITNARACDALSIAIINQAPIRDRSFIGR
jgi:hypothetical protein